jgi:hypothetical protein
LNLRNLGWKASLHEIFQKVFFSLSDGLAQRILGGCTLIVLAE